MGGDRKDLIAQAGAGMMNSRRGGDGAAARHCSNPIAIAAVSAKDKTTSSGATFQTSATT
jgi:hypothetical protein